MNFPVLGKCKFAVTENNPKPHLNYVVFSLFTFKISLNKSAGRLAFLGPAFLRVFENSVIALLHVKRLIAVMEVRVRESPPLNKTSFFGECGGS